PVDRLRSRGLLLVVHATLSSRDASRSDSPKRGDWDAARERSMVAPMSAAGLAFSADGADVYFVDNRSGQFNLWSVGIESGELRQLTDFRDWTVRLVAVSPADGTIALCADHDGDEFNQLYLVRPGEEPEQITDRPEVQHFV